MNKYLIWYFGSNSKINDIIFADSKLEACKKFLIKYNGTYYVHKVEEMK